MHQHCPIRRGSLAAGMAQDPHDPPTCAGRYHPPELRRENALPPRFEHLAPVLERAPTIVTRRKTLLAGYAVLAAADATFAATRIRRARWLTKPALMPLLAAAAITPEQGAGGASADPMMLAGLGLSWLGDVALLGDGDGPFAAGLGSFLAAHFFYLAALRRRRKHAVRRRGWIAGGYVLAWCVLNTILWSRTGRFRLPVLVYGTTLSAMAIAALDTGCPATAVGGAAFLLSDSILAMDNFGVVELPAADAMVMMSYTAAQALIALSSSTRCDRPGAV